MTDKQLELFITIADQGSFSRAETVEYISKQAMLRQINSLENEVGVKLLNRTTGGITLTEAGQEFYRGASQILKMRDDTFARCRKYSPAPEVIRIGQVAHQALLNHVTDAFAAKYPDIEIRKVINPHRGGEYRVAHDIADVGETYYSKFTATEPNAYRKLENLPYVAAMNHKHPLARRHHIALTELTDYPTLVFPVMMKEEYLAKLQRLFEESGKAENLRLCDDVDEQVSTAFQCSTSDAILLTANCFVYYIPELTVRLLDTDWFQEYGIICRPNPSRAVQKYVDLATVMFETNPLAPAFFGKDYEDRRKKWNPEE